MLSLIAKMGEPAMVGQFSLALAITTPVVLLSGAPKFIQITAHEGEFGFGDYVVARTGVLAAGALVVAAIALLSHYDTSTVAVIALMMTAKVFDSLSDGVYGLLQQREVMDRIAQSRALQGVLQVAALGLTMWLTHSIAWAALSLAATSAFVTATFDARSAGAMLTGAQLRKIGIMRCYAAIGAACTNWGRISCRKLCGLAAPVGIVVVLMTLNTSILRYLVEQNLGAAELGLFAAMSYCGYAGSTVVNALGQALTPALARRARSADWHGFLNLLMKFSALASAAGILFVVAALVWGRPIMTILYTREYANDQRIFVLIAAASAIAYFASTIGYGLTAARYLRSQLPLHLSVLATTVGVGLLTIPSRHLEGAAITMIAATIVQAIASASLLAFAWFRRPVLQTLGSK
jgi:O-antigen/teichoic acid export membrane protein